MKLFANCIGKKNKDKEEVVSGLPQMPKGHVSATEDANNLYFNITDIDFNSNFRIFCLSSSVVKFDEYAYPCEWTNNFGHRLFGSMNEIKITINIENVINNWDDYKQLRKHFLSSEWSHFFESVFNRFEKKHCLPEANTTDFAIKHEARKN